MTYGNTQVVSPPRASVATLVWTVPVRVIDVSRSGCRLEAACWMRPGMSGQLTLSLQGKTHEDDVRIARCQIREGAGRSYLVGAELLRTRRLNGHSIRLAIVALIGDAASSVASPPIPSWQALPDRESEQQAKGVSRAPPVRADAES